MDLTTILKLFFPSWLFDHFEVTKVSDNTDEERIDIFLDEKQIKPPGYETFLLYSHGYTPCYTVQDFPVRGKAVYLHLRRHRWKVIQTGEIVTGKFDFACVGTRFTNEFVSFLKESN